MLLITYDLVLCLALECVGNTHQRITHSHLQISSFHQCENIRSVFVSRVMVRFAQHNAMYEMIGIGARHHFHC